MDLIKRKKMEKSKGISGSETLKFKRITEEIRRGIEETDSRLGSYTYVHTCETIDLMAVLIDCISKYGNVRQLDNMIIIGW